MFKCFYEITVTSPEGKVLHKGEEYSGYSTSEEIMYLRRRYPDCKVEAEYKQIDLDVAWERLNVLKTDYLGMKIQ